MGMASMDEGRKTDRSEEQRPKEDSPKIEIAEPSPKKPGNSWNIPWELLPGRQEFKFIEAANNPTRQKF
jgi:hypothetical protein